ncbi:MAG: aldo/keto reductase [Candidatus Lokiarchaeota archaeon]|nr:aldo/keto reductase [Candidatus Lokiarchaeota archaeon]
MELTIDSTVELNNGIKMPRLGFGTWKLKRKSAINPIKWALDAGYRLIDTATFYKNEKYIGKAIKESEIPREALFITSKVWDTDQGFNKTLKAFNESLKKLNTDYLDLYLIHWPRKLRNETWKALEKLYEDDKVKSIGVANFAIHHLKEIIENFEIIPAVNQFELHPFNFVDEKDLIEFCRAKEIHVEAYSPLTHGRKLNNSTLKSISDKYDKSTAQVLIRWSLQHGFICIPKSGSENHIKENANVFDFELSEKDMKEIDTIKENFRLLDDTSKWD